MRRLWYRLVAFGFRLLYNELAWLYDPVSWLVSKGLWRRWQRTALAYLPAAGTVLEVGFGPGHLLADLATAGYRPVGLDLSPAMLRQARRRGLALRLCRGRAEALPFAPGIFDAVVLTFPTPFAYDPAWLRHSQRVLKPGGRLVVVEMTSFQKRTTQTRLLEWLFRITGQRGPAPDLLGLLIATGLSAERQQVQVEDTRVSLVLAEKPGAPQ
jgi:ubiquinone/menaquinone biosynthesis C-methylase UbiE